MSDIVLDIVKTDENKPARVMLSRSFYWVGAEVGEGMRERDNKHETS